MSVARGWLLALGATVALSLSAGMALVSSAPAAWATGESGAGAGATTTPTTAPGAPPTATTLVPIDNRLPAPPVTLPLVTRPASAHVDSILAKVSLAGFALFFVLLAVQTILTRSRRDGRWTL